jgi:hypothetical protein
MKRQITGSGSVARLALLWEQRRFLFHGAAIGLVASKSDSGAYTSTIPPDQKGQGMASMLAGLGKTTGDPGIFSGAEEHRGPVRWRAAQPTLC